MVTCSVIGCTSGYKTNPVKTHFFKAPRDPEHLELWRKTIKKTNLQSKHFICQKHFLQKDILWQRILRGPDGQVLGVSPYKIPRLQKDIVPSQFLLHQDFTQKSSPSTPMDASSISTNTFEVKNDTKSSPTTMDASNISTNTSEVKNNTKRSEDITIPMNPSCPSKSTSDMKNESQSSEAREKDNETTYFENNTNCSNNTPESITLSFDNLLSDVIIPVGWITQYMSTGSQRIISIAQRSFVKIDESYNTFMQKEIIIDTDFTVQLEILDERIDLTMLKMPPRVEDIHQLQNIIDGVDKIAICSGSHQYGQMPSINCKTVKQDITQSWRHINCSLIISKSTICDFCRTAKKTVATGVRRLEKSLEPKRVSLPISPTHRRQWLSLKAKLRAAQRQCQRNKKKIEKMRS